MGKCLSCCVTPATASQDQHLKYSAPPTSGESTAAPTDITPAIGDAKSFAEKLMFLSSAPTASKGGDLGAKRGSETKINALFQTYKDANEDAILSEGIEKLCQDLQVRPEEFRVLALAWRLDAEQMCRFSRREFVEGCRTLRVDTLAGLQAVLPELESEVTKDPQAFKELYRFAFRFGLEAGQRILPTEMAIQLWRLVFSPRLSDHPFLERWISFLESHPHIRGIPRDTWNMFLNFVEAVGPDLSAYDDTEAWPCLFDDFVEFENDQANQNIHKDNMAAPSL